MPLVVAATLSPLQPPIPCAGIFKVFLSLSLGVWLRVGLAIGARIGVFYYSYAVVLCVNIYFFVGLASHGPAV